MTTKKEDILKFLKQFGRMPTSKIGVMVGADYNTVLKLLNELKDEEKIIQEKETNAVFWRRDLESETNKNNKN